MKYSIPMVLMITCLLSACAATPHQRAQDGGQSTAITMANAQQIVKGMSSAEVIVLMGGGPNMREDDGDGEVWVYSMISSTSKASSSKGGVSALILRSAGVGVGGQYSQAASSTTSSQKTLTVIVHFDADKKVKSVKSLSTHF